MPIAVTRDGRVVLLDYDQNLVCEINEDLIRACLVWHAHNTQEEAEHRRREQENKQRELERQRKEKELDIRRTEIETKGREVDNALRTLRAKNKEIERRERDVTSERERVTVEMAILVQKQSLNRQRLEHERVERERLESERRELEMIVRRDMEFLQRDRADLVERANIEQQRLKEKDHERKQLNDELQLEKEQLWKVRQDLNRQNAIYEEENRKVTGQLHKQERLAQVIEEQFLQNILRVEVEHAEEIVHQKEIWEKKIEKFQEKANKSRENGERAITQAKAKAAKESRNRATADRKLKEVEILRVKVEHEFNRFREEARSKLNALVAEQSAKDATTHAELERTHEDVRKTTQELQDLRAQMVEMELRNTREQAASRIEFQPDPKGSSIVQLVDHLGVPKEHRSEKPSSPKGTTPTPIEDIVFTPKNNLSANAFFSRSWLNVDAEDFDEEVDSDLTD